jgi:hypothetical protein
MTRHVSSSVSVEPSVSRTAEIMSSGVVDARRGRGERGQPVVQGAVPALDEAIAVEQDQVAGGATISEKAIAVRFSEPESTNRQARTTLLPRWGCRPPGRAAGAGRCA